MLSLIAALWLAGAPTATETQAAVDGLLQAHAFEGASIGIGGRLSNGVRDFRVVARDKDAAALFAKVTAEGTPAGRLYGLAGLYFVDPAAFERVKATAVAPDTQVQTMFGCILGQEKAAMLLIRIGHGDYSSEFLGAERGSPWVDKWAGSPGVERNTSAGALAGKPGFDTRFTVSVPYANADANGMPATTELMALQRIEDLLTIRLQSRRTAVVALKQTGDKLARFVFYTHDTSWPEAVVTQIHSELPARTFTTASEADPGWSLYKSAR